MKCKRKNRATLEYEGEQRRINWACCNL